MIGFGLVGVGGYGARWLEALWQLEAQGIAHVAAAVIRSPERYEQEMADLRQRGCAIYPDMDGLLADSDVAIIGLPTGIASHAPLAIRALEAGYPVIVEKPLTATIQAARSVQHAETKSGQWCAVAYQWIHSPTIQSLRRLLCEGRLGRMREARCVIGWPRTQAYYQRNAWAGQLTVEQAWVLDGPATNATAHYFTNMFYLAQAQADHPPQIDAVRAELYRANPIASYDTSCIEVLLEDGTRLIHYASHALRDPIEPMMLLSCERGMVIWQAAADRATIAWHDGNHETIINPDPSWNAARPLEQAARVVAGRDGEPLCGTAEAIPHVLSINLAFESSATIARIPDSFVREIDHGDQRLYEVPGMTDLLRRAMVQGRLFSELGATWSRATDYYPAAGYRGFPESPALQAFVDREPQRDG